MLMNLGRSKVGSPGVPTWAPSATYRSYLFALGHKSPNGNLALRGWPFVEWLAMNSGEWNHTPWRLCADQHPSPWQPSPSGYGYVGLEAFLKEDIRRRDALRKRVKDAWMAMPSV